MRMDRRRVVVVGMGIRSPIGNNPGELIKSLKERRSGISIMPEWQHLKGLRTRVAGLCDIKGEEESIPRQNRRSMGRVAVLAALSAMDAVNASGLGEEEIASQACGVSYGSTEGSVRSQMEYIGNMIRNRSLEGIPPSWYLKCMSHTCAGNLSILFHTRGPFLASCPACVSGSHGIGFGYEAIKSGKADIMITGGADEVDILSAAVFDLMMATSCNYNERPSETPRPFDEKRDGLVVAEGAATLVLEEYERARKRGASILGEIEGFWTNGSGAHLTNSDARSMEECLLAALKDAGHGPDEIQYVSAHATGTTHGDEVEAAVTHKIYGADVPVTSIKGYMGHTMGACGAIEAIATLLMMREGFIAPTLNLEGPDPALPPLNHVIGEPRDQRSCLAASNNFAFGGVNTSLVLSLV
jgi:3-oxoacyl-[acyl-carrier-protein] synthase II